MSIDDLLARSAALRLAEQDNQGQPTQEPACRLSGALSPFAAQAEALDNAWEALRREDGRLDNERALAGPMADALGGLFDECGDMLRESMTLFDWDEARADYVEHHDPDTEGAALAFDAMWFLVQRCLDGHCRDTDTVWGLMRDPLTARAFKEAAQVFAAALGVGCPARWAMEGFRRQPEAVSDPLSPAELRLVLGALLSCAEGLHEAARREYGPGDEAPPVPGLLGCMREMLIVAGGSLPPGITGLRCWDTIGPLVEFIRETDWERTLESTSWLTLAARLRGGESPRFEELRLEIAEAARRPEILECPADPAPTPPAAPPLSPADVAVVKGGDTPSSARTPNASAHDLEPARRLAYFSFQAAQAKAGGRLEDREAYDMLREEGFDEKDGELFEYKLPAFDTWSRYLRECRLLLGENKNRARRGRRAGGSVVREADL